MRESELRQLASQHGLAWDQGRSGAGKFRDLEIGCGASQEAHHAFIDALRAKGVPATLCGVNNPEHPDYGKNYVEVPSFWCDGN